MDALVRFAGVGMETASEGRMRNRSSNQPRIVEGSQLKASSDQRAHKAVLQERTSNTFGTTRQRNTRPDSHKRSRPLSAECSNDNFDDDSSSSSSSSDSSYESDFELDDNDEMDSVSNLSYYPQAHSTVESKQSTPRNRRRYVHTLRMHQPSIQI